jgi:hypothetical protein
MSGPTITIPRLPFRFPSSWREAVGEVRERTRRIRYTIRALPVGDISDLNDHINAVFTFLQAGIKGTQPTPEVFNAAVDGLASVISRALIYRHPGCTPEWVKVRVGMKEAVTAFTVILHASGMFEQKAGASPGEAESP